MSIFKTSGALSVVIIGFFIFAGCTATKQRISETRPQTVCPVMGGKINRDVYADYDGRRIYFCCSGCIARFKENPTKYIKILDSDNLAVRQHSCKEINSAGNLPETGCGGCQSKCKNKK